MRGIKHKAMFEIFTAVSKLKRDGPFIVVKACNCNLKQTSRVNGN